jgi:hypothetical protein
VKWWMIGTKFLGNDEVLLRKFPIAAGDQL